MPHCRRAALAALAVLLLAYSASGRRDVGEPANGGRRLTQTCGAGAKVCQKNQRCLYDDSNDIKCLGAGFLNSAASATAFSINAVTGRAVMTNPDAGTGWSSFELTVCVQGAVPAQCKTVACPTATCTIPDLQAQTTYFVRAMAVKGLVKSRASQPATFTTPVDLGSGLYAEAWFNFYSYGSKLPTPAVYTALGKPTYTGTVANLNCFTKFRNNCHPLDRILPANSFTNLEYYYFTTRFTGHLRVTEPGSYKFQLASDDGSRLTINGQVLINMDQQQAYTEQISGSVDLDVGDHSLLVEYFQRGGEVALAVMWLIPGASEFTRLPASALFGPV